VTLLLFLARVASAQEAGSGFDLRATVSAGMYEGAESTEPPRDGSPWTGGFRVVVYPTLKLDDHWTVSGAIQAYSQPYFADELDTSGHALKANILQATLNYSRFWKNGSMVLRVGELSSAFGSFLLRYDDADNPLIQLPQTYGYYYEPVSILGLSGAEADGTFKKLDFRAQFVNSSPVNPRSILDHDQYGNWAGGAGYTLRQGLRVGVSAFRGPYLSRDFDYYFPGEAPPNQLPAGAFGVDVQWATGHWTTQFELQRFVMTYHAIPTFHEQAGYAEVRRVLHPRWFIAERTGYLTNSVGAPAQEFEAVAGFRPDTRQIVKVGYGVSHTSGLGGKWEPTFELQLVTTLHPLSFAGN